MAKVVMLRFRFSSRVVPHLLDNMRIKSSTSTVYSNNITTVTLKHHDLLKSYYATQCVDRRAENLVATVLAAEVGKSTTSHTTEMKIPLVLICIGSVSSSMTLLTTLAPHGSRMAVFFL